MHRHTLNVKWRACVSHATNLPTIHNFNGSCCSVIDSDSELAFNAPSVPVVSTIDCVMCHRLEQFV